MDDSDLGEMGTPAGSSSFDEAMSAGAQSEPGGGEEEEEEDEEDPFYIPERRPSLDLGPSPMDTTHWQYVDKALQPVQNYGSMTSEENLDEMEENDESSTRVHLARTGSYSSCYSVNSDDLDTKIPKVKVKDETDPESSPAADSKVDQDKISHPSLTVAFTFKTLSKILEKLSPRDLDRFEKLLWKRYPRSLIMPPKGQDMVGLVDWLLQYHGLEGSMQITKALLEDMDKKNLSEYLQTLRVRNEVRHDLMETLRKIYCSDVCVDATNSDQKKPFSDVFTDLYLSSTCDNGPNIDHEVLTIPKLDSNRDGETLLSISDIMSEERLQRSSFRLLLVTGPAGSGKTMALRKLLLDWMEGRAHQNLSFIFPLPFRELRQFEGKEVSLIGMVNALYPMTERLTAEDYESRDCPILFVFDGLDEYRDALDFRNTELHNDPAALASLNVIVVNVLCGRMAYRGAFMFFTRHQVRRVVPWDTPYDEIDLRGFRGNADQNSYFQRRFKNPNHAARVIAYVDSMKTLRVMCHLPLFCSLVADEFQRALRERGEGAELPRNITFMYTKLLLELIRPCREFRAPDRTLDEERAFLMKLGKLAHKMLEDGEFSITKARWKEVGLSEEEAVVSSGLCLQFITRPYVLYQEKTLSFLHPSLQEYLAALYVFLSFRNQEKNVYEQKVKDKVKEKLAGLFKAPKAGELYRSAVDRSLGCTDGRLDVFLRFLLGMALPANLEMLRPFCTSTAKWPTMVEDAAAHIRKRIQENQHPDRNQNLRQCLEELGVR